VAAFDNESDRLSSIIDLQSDQAKINSSFWAKQISRLKDERKMIEQGGGTSNIERQHKKNRLTARERIDLLIDPQTDFHELSQFAAFEMYNEWGGAPAAGTLTGLCWIGYRDRGNSWTGKRNCSQ